MATNIWAHSKLTIKYDSTNVDLVNWGGDSMSIDWDLMPSLIKHLIKLYLAKKANKLSFKKNREETIGE